MLSQLAGAMSAGLLSGHTNALFTFFAISDSKVSSGQKKPEVLTTYKQKVEN